LSLLLAWYNHEFSMTSVFFFLAYERNVFAEISKNLARYRPKKILLRHQNNYAHLSWLLEFFLQHCLLITLLCLSFPYNYFDGTTKLFSDLYLVKFWDTPAKSFFSCRYYFIDWLSFSALSYSVCRGTRVHRAWVPVLFIKRCNC